ncbi:MAG TPA: D-alanine--D-alanine ligase [Gammaproteobacteria bacterium]|nr:D-alanine--D-alanine ligase [Gammaproteobacteria bacterium]
MPKPLAILHDAHAALGPPDQSDTLLEAQAIAAAVRGLGYAPAIVPVGLDLTALERTLAELAPEAVFNLVESLEGRGRLVPIVPALLESLGLPYTGCSAVAIGLTSDKRLAKRLLAQAGIATPPLPGAGPTDGKWIVKSVWEHASLGLDDGSIVDGASVVRTIDRKRAEHGGEWFAEQYVPGRELNVALLGQTTGPRVLPVAEIRFDGFPSAKPRIVGYAAKWHTESFEYRHTVRSFAVEPELAARVARIALDCWELFRLDGYARVDFRVDERGEPWVLEVNANPCLSPDAGYAAALAEAGVEYSDALEDMLGAALERQSKSRGAR